jgi:hypothetical protein
MLRVAAVLSLFVCSLLAFAQGAPTVRIRGDVEAFDGQMLTVKARDGSIVRVKMADNFTVGGLVQAKLADATPGKFVGTAAMPQPDGTLRAIEVLIFPESGRGTGEGHYPWDLQPQSTMTNATIAEVVAAPDGRTVTLRYKDGEKRVFVPESAPIVTAAPADRSLLVPGAHIFIFAAQRQSDGTLTASRVTVGLNGLVPPM